MEFIVMTSFAKPQRMLALAVSAAAIMAAGAQTYRLTDLGTLGGPTAGAYAINEQGHVGGTATREDAASHGFIWDGAMHDVDPVGAFLQGHVFDLTDDDVVAASAFDLGDVQQQGVIWDGQSPTMLGAFTPRGIQSAGSVVGHVTFEDVSLGWVDRAARWDQGTLDLLGGLGGDCDYALAVAADGRIVGASRLAGNVAQHACLWQGGFVHDLGTLGGADSQAYALNGVGEIVGWALTSAGAPHAFLVRVDAAGNVTVREDLGELGGGCSYAYGVNDAGQVVGTSDARAFLWQDGLMTDLNAEIPGGTGWRLEVAWDINEAGWITGVGQRDGFARGFLLSPAGCSDLNADGVTDLADLAILLSRFGTTTGATFVHGDLDGDGDVDLTDLAVLLAQFGTTCG